VCPGILRSGTDCNDHSHEWLQNESELKRTSWPGQELIPCTTESFVQLLILSATRRPYPHIANATNAFGTSAEKPNDVFRSQASLPLTLSKDAFRLQAILFITVTEPGHFSHRGCARYLLVRPLSIASELRSFVVFARPAKTVDRKPGLEHRSLQKIA